MAANITLKFADIMGNLARGDKACVIVEAADWNGTKYLQKFGRYMTPAMVGPAYPLLTIEARRAQKLIAHVEAQGLTAGWQYEAGR